MSKEIIEVLDHICEKLGIAIDWTSQNIMPQVTDVLHRYTNYNITISAIWLCVCMAVLFVAFIVYKRLITDYFKLKNDKKSSLFYNYNHYSLLAFNDEIELNGIGITVLVISMFGTILGMVGLVFNISDLLSWIFVPEINIVKMLQGMI